VYLCVIHVWCAFCHTIIKGNLLTYLLTYMCEYQFAIRMHDVRGAAISPVFLYYNTLGDE